MNVSVHIIVCIIDSNYCSQYQVSIMSIQFYRFVHISSINTIDFEIVHFTVNILSTLRETYFYMAIE